MPSISSKFPTTTISSKNWCGSLRFNFHLWYPLVDDVSSTRQIAFEWRILEGLLRLFSNFKPKKAVWFLTSQRKYHEKILDNAKTMQGRLCVERDPVAELMSVQQYLRERLHGFVKMQEKEKAEELEKKWFREVWKQVKRVKYQSGLICGLCVKLLERGMWLREEKVKRDGN